MVNKIVNKFYELNEKYWKIAAALTFVALLLLGYGLWYIFTHETTDDAFIEGDVTVISPKVAGNIEMIYVVDNQTVKAQAPLCDIDDRDYQSSFNLANAQKEGAIVEEQQAAQDALRYQKLLAGKDISQQQYDKALLRWNTAKAQLQAAQARLDQAELNLSYTKIVAPADGVVTQKALEPGMYVEQAQALMAIVLEDRWVIANLKETQMTHIHPGLKVTINVDAYPGVVFHGHVESIQQGTGSRFSLLPAENATGNYIKVVQRVPVKIVFDGQQDPKRPLELGMSVVPTIDLSSR
jgi:membrane fusion protein (multidrug efflux system)